MKLASLKSGRDGELLVVSRDMSQAVRVGDRAPTLQFALDHWDSLEAPLRQLYDALNDDLVEGAFALDMAALGAPLPRSYQYLDGACYLSHIQRNRAARGETLPADLLEKPLVYQGISHGFMAWNDPICLPDDGLGIDFEAEIAAITGDVPMGVSPEKATDYIRLFVLLNDVSLRTLIPAELKRTFGFVTSKSASTLGPIAVTPDELGELWDGKLVSGKMKCWVRGKLFGDIETGIDTPFHYGHMIAHVAQTRDFEPGSLVGLGTVSNEDDSVGCGCIGEWRALETIKTGQATTSLLKFGERVRIEHFDRKGRSVFGAINQVVAQRKIN
jgi:fumarylacetoacetate (FAA) hydrolase